MRIPFTATRCCRDFQPGIPSLSVARFDDAQNFFGVFEIEFGDADAVVEAQDLRIKISCVGGDHEAQRFAVELARVEPIVGCDFAVLRFLPHRSTS